jgi:predicted Rossmann-fold nucleotide-binding protein
MEIESRAAFDNHLRSQHGSLAGCRVQAVDLIDRGWELRTADVTDTVFLGCVLSESVAADVRQRGAMVFPPAPHLPFDPYRAALYTAPELYDGIAQKSYEQTPDALTYAWESGARDREDVLGTVLRGLHDDSITDALGEYLEGRRTVAVLGGHAVARDSSGYEEAAYLGRTLTRAGFTVATGGGPGAMEAANLGAYLARYPDSALDDAVGALGAARDFRSDPTAWARAAFAVRAAFPAERAGESLSVPTWFYGHEPPNAFATAIAKYFSNAAREDWLLARAASGLVFLPGAAGTVQEIFQAATPAYYTPVGTAVRRLILVGVNHWTNTLPAWPLLRALAYSRPMATTIHLVDTAAEAGILLTRVHQQYEQG